MNKEHDLNFDVIIVGSGPSGAMAAQTIAKTGKNTAMLDAGFRDTYYRELIPDKDFLTIRMSDPDQHVYFLGREFEGIQAGGIKTGPQLTPPRRFAAEGTDKWLPIESNTFHPLESLAYGGLGSAWGLNCFTFSGKEIEAAGLEKTSLNYAYQTVADRIGISGTQDDASPYCAGELKNLQPPAAMEKSLNGLFFSYQKRKKDLNKMGVYVGRTALALLTKDFRGRKKTEYSDMDFWANPGNSAYRPAVTIDELKKSENFSYYGGYLVIKFSETKQGVEVIAKRIDDETAAIFRCKTLILASGTLGTARIIMRSANNAPEALPLLCNSYCYFACFQPRMLGQKLDDRKISYSQLGLFYDPGQDNFNAATVLFYTYRSLLFFRLAKELPFNFRDSARILALTHPALVIAGFHHPEKASPNKYLQLTQDASSPTGDKLVVHFELTEEEKKENEKREQKVKYALRKIGCYPIKRIDPGYGSSIHYGGTLPFEKIEKPFTLSPSGRLHGTSNIYVADGSGFRYLPSKGPTLTLMANAHLTALNALKRL